jgi:hypothetical protein
VGQGLVLAVQPGQGLFQVGQLFRQRRDLGVGLGGLDDHRLAGVAALEDDRAQLADHLLHLVQPLDRAVVQRIGHGGLGHGLDGRATEVRAGTAVRARTEASRAAFSFMSAIMPRLRTKVRPD